ncbi:unnamed protein product [Calypogeia fissa]
MASFADASGRSGGRGDQSFGFGYGGRGAGRHSLRSGFSTRGNPLWGEPMDHDQTFAFQNATGVNREGTSAARDRASWEQSNASKAALSKIAEITTEQWSEHEYVECQWDFAEAA